MPNPSKPLSSESVVPADRRPFYMRLWPMLGLTVSVLIIAIACVLLWAGNKYQALVELGKDTGHRYATIETEHPFTKPQPDQTQAIRAQRWEAMFAVRARLTEKITPAMDRLVHTIPNMEKPRSLAAATELMALTGDLKAMVDEHLAALEDNAMSASEYCWLLGLAVNGALAEGADSAAGQAYRDILGVAERLSHANHDTRDDISAENIIQEFSRSFDGQTPGIPWVVEDLEAKTRSVYVLDLLTLAMGKHSEEIR